MKNIPHAFVARNLMYTQTCTRLDIIFVVRMIGRYENNSGLDHWKTVKKVLKYLQRMKNHILTYKRYNHLEIIRYLDSDLSRCADISKLTFGYLFLFVGGESHGKVRSSQLLLHPL